MASALDQVIVSALCLVGEAAHLAIYNEMSRMNAGKPVPVKLLF